MPQIQIIWKKVGSQLSWKTQESFSFRHKMQTLDKYFCARKERWPCRPHLGQQQDSSHKPQNQLICSLSWVGWSVQCFTSIPFRDNRITNRHNLLGGGYGAIRDLGKLVGASPSGATSKTSQLSLLSRGNTPEQRGVLLSPAPALFPPWPLIISDVINEQNHSWHSSRPALNSCAYLLLISITVIRTD